MKTILLQLYSVKAAGRLEARKLGSFRAGRVVYSFCKEARRVGVSGSIVVTVSSSLKAKSVRL